VKTSAAAERSLYQGLANLMSHELRGPVAVLLGYADLLGTDALGPPGPGDPERVRRWAGDLAVARDLVDAIVTRTRQGSLDADLLAGELGPQVHQLEALARALALDFTAWREAGRHTPARSEAGLICAGKAVQLASLAAQVLTAARLFVTEPRVNAVQLDLGDWARRTVHAIAPAVAATGHRLRLDVAPRDNTVAADAELLTVALLNLIDNAQKFAPAGSTIRIKVGGDAREVVIEVQDSGPGLPAGLQVRAFGRIDHVDEKTFQVPGVGLGLATAAAVAAAHRGELRFANARRQGATVGLALPLKRGRRR
jgi:signal transduction histidine kinase